MKKITQLTLVLCVVLLFSTCATTKKEYADAVHEIDLFFLENSDWSARPFLLVEINGTEYQTVFDTGDYNGGILIPSQEIEKLSLEITRTTTSRRADTDWRETTVYNLPHMLIGDNLVVYDLVCRELIEVPVEVEAVIGMQSFKELYNILISYSQEKIYVWEKNCLPSFLSEWTKIPITDANNLFVSGTIDGNPYTFCLDTGAFGINNGKTYDISFEKLESFENASTATIPFTLEGREFSSNFWYMEFPNSDSIPIDFFLGYNFYSEHDVFIDFDEAMVYIEN